MYIALAIFNLDMPNRFGIHQTVYLKENCWILKSNFDLLKILINYLSVAVKIVIRTTDIFQSPWHKLLVSLNLCGKAMATGSYQKWGENRSTA